MLKKNHDRLRFSYSVPAQSGRVHRFNSTATVSLFGNASKMRDQFKIDGVNSGVIHGTLNSNSFSVVRIIIERKNQICVNNNNNANRNQ